MILSGAENVNDELAAFNMAVPPAISPMAPICPIGALFILR
jgi:hypothetical protein